MVISAFFLILLLLLTNREIGDCLNCVTILLEGEETEIFDGAIRRLILHDITRQAGLSLRRRRAGKGKAHGGRLCRGNGNDRLYGVSLLRTTQKHDCHQEHRDEYPHRYLMLLSSHVHYKYIEANPMMSIRFTILLYLIIYILGVRYLG